MQVRSLDMSLTDFFLVMLFGDFGENPRYGNVVEDPYYGGRNGFDINFDQLTYFSECFIKEVI